MNKVTAAFFGSLAMTGIAAVVALAESTPLVSINESVDGFYYEATIDQRFVTSPRARPTDLIN